MNRKRRELYPGIYTKCFETRAVRDQHGRPWYIRVYFDLCKSELHTINLATVDPINKNNGNVTLAICYDGKLGHKFNKHQYYRSLSIKRGSIRFKNSSAEFKNGWTPGILNEVVDPDWPINQILRACDNKGALTVEVEVEIEFQFISGGHEVDNKYRTRYTVYKRKYWDEITKEQKAACCTSFWLHTWEDIELIGYDIIINFVYPFSFRVIHTVCC